MNAGLGRWVVTDNHHVIPEFDLFEHISTIECWCKPTNDRGVFIHHSKDCREILEPDYQGGRRDIGSA